MLTFEIFEKKKQTSVRRTNRAEQRSANHKRIKEQQNFDFARFIWINEMKLKNQWEAIDNIPQHFSLNVLNTQGYQIELCPVGINRFD